MVSVKLGKEIYTEALLAKLGSHGYPHLMEADSGEQTAIQAVCPSRSRSLVMRDKVARTQVRKWCPWPWQERGHPQAVILAAWLNCGSVEDTAAQGV